MGVLLGKWGGGRGFWNIENLMISALPLCKRNSVRHSIIIHTRRKTVTQPLQILIESHNDT